MFEIETIKGHDRMSTQDLLLAIEEAVRNGETEFKIHASGQHDIGGPLWNAEGKKLFFHVSNAGQRVGSMCLPNTEIVVEESTSADVGWLNAGGIITVHGDAGDTAGHCSAGGKIYIGGRAGTRSGSLMKHDPLYEEPELWILKNTGSFSFEFMGGGRAVVCGYDCDEFTSVLGERACVGMVGGVVYVRGPISSYPADICYLDLEQEDIDFLAGGMDEFLAKIQKPELKAELSDWSQWKKLRPLTFEEKQAQPKKRESLKEFRTQEWVKGGIFSDVAMDDFAVHNTISHGLYRLRVPSWDNAKFNAPCEFSCPTGIPTQRRMNLLRQGKVQEAIELELEYTHSQALSVAVSAQILVWVAVPVGVLMSQFRLAIWAGCLLISKSLLQRRKLVRKSALLVAVWQACLLLGSCVARAMLLLYMMMLSTSVASWSRLFLGAV